MPKLPTRVVAALLLAAAPLAGCDWPRDPEKTTDHIRGGVVRAGVSENPPFIHMQGGEAIGVEADLIREAARRLGARVQWVPAGETPLMQGIKSHTLDVVAGGVSAKDPWAKELGATRPYATVHGEKRVLLTPAGENRWVLELDRVVLERKAALAERLGSR